MTPETLRKRSFAAVLVNTFIANLTTSFLWFAVTFWMYLETRNVLVTSILGGGYMLAFAIMGVPFGSWIDRTRKKTVMVAAQGTTAVLFSLAALVFFLFRREQLLTLGSLPFILFILLLLVGAVMEGARGIALSTLVTLLVPDQDRARANGAVGIVNGLSFAVTSVLSGLAIAFLGMEWSLLIAVLLTVCSLLHLTGVAIPEPEIVHAEGAPKRVDFAGAWQAIREVPALVWLIVFTTFNNGLGGIYVALMDPYGLTLMSVEWWGILWGVLSFGFMVGGVAVARFGLGGKPLRSLLLANVAMWVIGFGFTLRESIWLMAMGILLYMVLIPVAEAAEQTVLQRVVPLPKQGRVFGFAQSIEVAAAPVTAFLIGPIAQYGLIPYLNTPAGRDAWGWLLGGGQARGIALVFVLMSLLGLTVTVLALATRPYRTLAHAYTAAAPVSPAPMTAAQDADQDALGRGRTG